MATATRNVNAVDIDGPDDLDKFVQDLMMNMASERHFFVWWIISFGVAIHIIDASSYSGIVF